MTIEALDHIPLFTVQHWAYAVEQAAWLSAMMAVVVRRQPAPVGTEQFSALHLVPEESPQCHLY